MNTLDWILAAIIALLAIRCMVRGFIEEVLSVASYVVGLLAAILLYKPAGAFVSGTLGVTAVPEIIGFVGVFLIAFFVVKILERMLHQALEAAQLDTADRVLGFILGAGEGLLVVSLVLIVISAQPLFDASKLLGGSVFAKHILPVVGPEVSKALGPALKDAPKLPKVELPKVQLPAVKKP